MRNFYLEQNHSITCQKLCKQHAFDKLNAPNILLDYCAYLSIHAVYTKVQINEIRSIINDNDLSAFDDKVDILICKYNNRIQFNQMKRKLKVILNRCLL